VHFGKFRNSQTLGKAQELRAAHYLKAQGLRLLCRNYRCRHGEIDLIMADSDVLVFVEVRYRRNDCYGGAIVSVDTRKQLKIRHTAAYYLQANPQLQCCSCRFDVIGLSRAPESVLHRGHEHLDWIKNAFY
jgi:putative endonuclease